MKKIVRKISLVLSIVMLLGFCVSCNKEEPQVDEPVEPVQEEIDPEVLKAEQERKAAEEREALLASINPEEKINDKAPFYIKVNRLANCVTIYTLDSDMEYTIPVKAMICSAGKEGHESPLGDYEITTVRPRWCYMVDGSYGQYCSGWKKGGYLFHSVCYSKQKEDSLIVKEYNDLGTNASLGCIRLQVIDAKWIFDNCMIGTPVTIYEDENPGPLGKPEKVIAFIDENMDNGWDPTDPSEDNPWRTMQ